MIYETTPGGYYGAAWLKANFKCEMSPLGVAVADLLGDVWEGIYHLNSSGLQKADWSNKDTVSVTLRVELATIDSELLTRLVVLCHDRMLRLNIQGVGPGYLRFRFHQREKRSGRMYERYPTLEDHAAEIRSYYQTQIKD